MIRFVHCIKARDDVSESEFRSAFKSAEMESFAQKIKDMTGADSYNLSLTLKIDFNINLMNERQGQEPYDAIIEFWWDSGKELQTFRENEEFAALQKDVTEFQQRFIDFSRSSRFFIEA